MSEPAHLWQLSLQAYLERTGTGGAAPGCGPAAALTLATGLALVTKGLHLARAHQETPERTALLERAAALQDRLAQLADDDAQAFAEYLQARRERASGDALTGELRHATRRTCAVPLATAHEGLEALGLALAAWPETTTELQSDTLAGALLIHAGIGAALIGVEADLKALDEATEREQAARARDHAREEADRCLAELRRRAGVA
ncbi:cyclodeaminase/cyclohydrolase family protein [Stutzerimonas azotifigens]|uniref:cyclodeaminase/cyclohydrolase family protein n=1 Tax=Stutzerimonas azotifigens TaxID=291995 RepID=UPI0003F86889|nr:cyclodeaminase/cyclohydrolase family protein [Stutzerimonas azotifigens]